MSKTEKEKWNEFLEWISNHSSTVYYRGESDNEYLLMPKVGRNNYSLVDEINMLEHFKRKANMYVKANNDFEWLALAQHHGLPTRLLDWTINPLVACFFAVNSSLEKTSKIYCLDKCENEILDVSEVKSPFEISEIKILYPPVVTNRIELQNGLFSIHPLPYSPTLIGSRQYDGLGPKNLLIEILKVNRYNFEKKVIFENIQSKEEVNNYLGGFYKTDKPYFEIEPEYKSYFNKMIRFLGVNETIYGDIDSIARNIEYQKNSKELHLISKEPVSSLIPITEHFVSENIFDYLLDNNFLATICDLKLFENKGYFRVSKIISNHENFKTVVGNLSIKTSPNFEEIDKVRFIHINYKKNYNFQKFINKMGLNMMINGQYSFDVDLKIKLLYFNNGFKFSKLEILDYSKEHIEYYVKDFKVKEEFFRKIKNQILEVDFKVIYNDYLDDIDLDKMVEKYKNKIIL